MSSTSYKLFYIASRLVSMGRTGQNKADTKDMTAPHDCCPPLTGGVSEASSLLLEFTDFCLFLIQCLPWEFLIRRFQGEIMPAKTFEKHEFRLSAHVCEVVSSRNVTRVMESVSGQDRCICWEVLAKPERGFLSGTVDSLLHFFLGSD